VKRALNWLLGRLNNYIWVAAWNSGWEAGYDYGRATAFAQATNRIEQLVQQIEGGEL
jgi:hypothetical protein